MRRYETVPHPYILSPSGSADGDTYSLCFAIIGQANRHLPVFLHALKVAAEGPKGVAGNQLVLGRVEQETSPGSDDWRSVYGSDGMLATSPPATPIVPPVLTGCEIHFLTPLRVKRDGRHVGPADFRFADLFGNLLRRVSMLTAHHTDTPLETNFRELIDAAQTVHCEARLRWRELTRYSTRQKTAMQMGGLVGTISVERQDLHEFWPYLWLGQWIHAGGGATMGLGQYRVTASLPNGLVQSNTSTMASLGAAIGRISFPSLIIHRRSEKWSTPPMRSSRSI